MDNRAKIDLPSEVLADLGSLADELAGVSGRRAAKPASELPSEVLADLRVLVDDMKQDRLPGFDHDPELAPGVPNTAAFSSVAVKVEANVTAPEPEPNRQATGGSALAPTWTGESGDDQPSRGARVLGWLGVNWPFVLAAAFMVLGVVLMIGILTAPPAGA